MSTQQTRQPDSPSRKGRAGAGRCIQGLQALLLLLLLAIPASPLSAQGILDYPRAGGAGRKFSLLTCGVGEEIYASFGHAAIRVQDPATGMDLVYNWGTFNGFEEGFEVKFMRGKLLYYCSVETYSSFLRIYIAEHRQVWEQELLLDSVQKQQLSEFLQWSAAEENKYYKYDFLFDNCATRIRDVFPETFGPALTFGPTIPADKPITFRQIINHYLAAQHWQRFGINLLLGRPVDARMKSTDAMFLPDYLRSGIAGAKVNGKAISSAPAVILPGGGLPGPGLNYAFLTVLFVSILLAIPVVRNPTSLSGRLAIGLVMSVTGLLGALMAFMWFGTDHGACQNNWNILWANPVHLLYPLFRRKRAKDRYALLSLLMIAVALVLALVGVQGIPLLEAGPWITLLLLVCGTIFRSSRVQQTA